MRFLDPVAESYGRIEIDGLPLHRIDRAMLRRQVLAVPQDAVFLPAGSTIKDNLDPTNSSNDEECMDVLRVIGLYQLFAQGDTNIHTALNPEHLSAGQKQLFSLGQAILRRRIKASFFGLPAPAGGILLLDELSSNVDQETERLMQDIIRREFEMYTVLTIAHRLDLVAEYCDIVIVMDTGRIVEQGAPRELLEDASSRFARLQRRGGQSQMTSTDDADAA